MNMKFPKQRKKSVMEQLISLNYAQQLLWMKINYTMGVDLIDTKDEILTKKIKLNFI